MDKNNLNKLKALLRLKQWEKALRGDTRMLMFLGKNYLDQSDRTETIYKTKPHDTLRTIIEIC